MQDHWPKASRRLCWRESWIKVGLDIIDWGFLRRAHRLSFKTALVMWGVLLMTVFWDPIGAVVVGMFVANLLTIESLTDHQLGTMHED